MIVLKQFEIITVFKNLNCFKIKTLLKEYLIISNEIIFPNSLRTERTWYNIELVPSRSFYPTEFDKYYNYWDIHVDARSFLYKQVRFYYAYYIISLIFITGISFS